MHRYKNIVLFSGLIMVLAGNATASQTNYAIGGTGGQELRVGLGARPAAMGEAFVGLADDVNSVSWNPAGLARLTGVQVSAMHSIYLADIACDFATFAYPLSPSTSVGAAVSYFNFGTLDKLDESGQLASTFTPFAMQGTAAYGHRLLPGLAWGLGLHFLQEQIDTEHYAAFGIDAGLQWEAPWKVQTAFVVQNLGTAIADAELGRQIKIGAGRAVPLSLRNGDVWQAAMDVNVPFADVSYTSIHLGTEYWYQDQIALRLGYQFKNGNTGGAAGLSAGFGARYSLFQLDYALVSYGDLGLTHQISLGLRL